MRWQVIRKAVSDYSQEGGYIDRELELSVQKETDGTFQPANRSSIDVIVARYFPADTRGFYFVDADEAENVVGGRQSEFTASTMRGAVTRSLHQLLGLKTLRESKSRLKQLENDRSKELTRVVGDDDLTELQDAAEKLQVDQKDLTDEQEDLAGAVDEATGKVEGYGVALQGLGEQQEELDGLNKGVEDAQTAYSDKRAKEATTNTYLGSLLRSEELYASLMKPLLDGVAATLIPMRVDGVLPPHEVGLLPKLLDIGECVCGRPLDDGHLEAREHVEERLRVSIEFAESHEYLHQVLTSVERHLSLSHQNWAHDASTAMDSAREVSGEAREAFEALESAKEARENFASRTSETSITENLEQLRSWNKVLEEKKAKLKDVVERLDLTSRDIRSVSEKLRIALSSNKELGPARHQLRATNRLYDIVEEVEKNIELKQIPDVSEKLNHIFRSVIQATDQSHFSEVGIESIELQAGTQYGLYAKDGSGGPKEIQTANGASRRALAVAYVLALTEATESRVPFVADSLLHALSGTVKRSTVRYLVDGERIEQPIIFCTRDDVLDPPVAEVIREAAGSTYTLTTQTRVVQDGLGDVVRYDPRASSPRCSVICGCSIDEYCDVCEIVGDATSNVLTKRDD